MPAHRTRTRGTGRGHRARAGSNIGQTCRFDLLLDSCMRASSRVLARWHQEPGWGSWLCVWGFMQGVRASLCAISRIHGSRAARCRPALQAARSRVCALRKPSFSSQILLFSGLFLTRDGTKAATNTSKAHQLRNFADERHRQKMQTQARQKTTRHNAAMRDNRFK